ncbi:MAG TPA: hypothetical protein PKE06_08935 [Flavilitoribacter sp.]|nr:hypothetical protein [Flavilitoribacter sp.]HMQ89773.1 hypothetical protein [Flavilitoribacter sp.]
MNAKKLIIGVFAILILNSCKTTIYGGYIGQSVSTTIELSEANFKVLGSFTGSASARKAVWSIKDKTGVVSDAKNDLIANAKKAGIELTGARTLINITTDIIQNPNRITCTMSAEIIEFTK